ncbi:MAG: hypothetical protein Tsb0017_03300 [Geothermobacteraceae bacterium]
MARKKKQQTETEAPVEPTEPLSVEDEQPREGEGQSDLTVELDAAREEARKNWDLYLRSQADLENYRKRVQREKQEMARFANEGLLRELLPVIDNLQRAVDHAREQQNDAGALIEGVEMTLGQFASTLEKFGVTPVEAAGKPFDPALHEAMGQMVSEDMPPNHVVQELQKGYRLHDRLLRPALVMVSKAPEVDAEAAAGSGTDDETEQN